MNSLSSWAWLTNMIRKNGPRSVINEKGELPRYLTNTQPLRKKFGEYIHKLKQELKMRGDDNFDWDDLIYYAKELKDRIKNKRKRRI